MLRIKRGPYGARLGREMALASMMMVVDQAMSEAGFDYEISSGLEGQHMEGSLHYKGEAADWVVRSHIPGNRGASMAERVEERLNEDFDVIWHEEKKVLHVEWQPKSSFGKLG
jgi:hypothetical protein